MAYNYVRAQNVAHRMINKYGAPAILRRTEGDRRCIAVELEFDPRETTKLANPTARLFLVSTNGVSVAPNNEKDRLVTFYPGTDVENEVLKIVAPTGHIAPAGIVVYWELQCAK
jgi:hypothetical protein